MVDNISINSKKDLLHLLQVVEFAVAKAFRAIGFVTINTKVAVLVASDHIFAPETLGSRGLLVLGNHTSLILISTASMFFNALHVDAKANSFFLSLVKNEFVSQIV